MKVLLKPLAYLSFLLTACQFNLQDENPNTDAPALSRHLPALGLDELCISPLQPQSAGWKELGLWDRIQHGYALPEQHNPRIQRELNWFTKHPEYIERVSQRGANYWHYIVGELEKRGMPLELAWLPIVESGFDPFAYSPGRASGMWQIIPGTAKELGLKQSWWYDGRRDIIASTEAALNYLEALQVRFDGDWFHAIAAYNSGGGRVAKAIRSNQKKEKPTDFWNLKLPRETAAYVPRLLALAELFKHPGKYGIELMALPNTPVFTRVDVVGQIDLAQAAALADISMDHFYQLNPGFNRWASDPEGPHGIVVPVQQATTFKDRLAALAPDQRLTWRRHTVQQGETLSHIARHYRLSVKTLQVTNDIQSTAIRAGQILLVPSATKGENHYSLSAEQRLVKRQSQPAKRNAIKRIHKVESGDSYWKIARTYEVSSAQLAKWNGMSPKDPLRVGKRLVIWDTAASPAHKGEVIRKLSYTVKRGDSLAKIASKFRVKVRDIASWNDLNAKNYLQPGQTLVLYVDVKKG